MSASFTPQIAQPGAGLLGRLQQLVHNLEMFRGHIVGFVNILDQIIKLRFTRTPSLAKLAADGLCFFSTATLSSSHKVDVKF